jgi:transcriptional antiterminator RfaH
MRTMRQDASDWYAVYTQPRAEKKAASRLSALGIRVYLPLLRTIRKWSDRKKWVDVPLIPSYLFVNICEAQQVAVLQVLGVSRFIVFEGRPVKVKPDDILWMQRLLQSDAQLEATAEYLLPGDLVEVQHGTLMGFQGELVEYKSEKKVLLRLKNLGQSVLVTIAPGLLRKLSGDMEGAIEGLPGLS